MTSPESGAPGRAVPKWRNPWLVAGIAGIATITLLRPVLRNVPPSPPVLAAVPSFRFTGRSGPVTPATLAGQVHVVAIANTVNGNLAPRWAALTLGGKLADGIAATRTIRVLLVEPCDVSPPPSAPSVLVRVCGSTAEVVAFARAVSLALGHEAPPPNADVIPLGLVLVDGKGRLRGLYELSDDGLDEAFHRASRVVSEPWEGGP